MKKSPSKQVSLKLPWAEYHADRSFGQVFVGSLKHSRVEILMAFGLIGFADTQISRPIVKLLRLPWPSWRFGSEISNMSLLATTSSLTWASYLPPSSVPCQTRLLNFKTSSMSFFRTWSILSSFIRKETSPMGLAEKHWRRFWHHSERYTDPWYFFMRIIALMAQLGQTKITRLVMTVCIHCTPINLNLANHLLP